MKNYEALQTEINRLTQEIGRLHGTPDLAAPLKLQVRALRHQMVDLYWEELEPIHGIEDVPGLPIPMTPWHCERLVTAGAIPKKDLVDGAYYAGKCRNADVAVWDAPQNVFIYQRTKFGDTYPEDINHFEDDNGYDLFVPVALLPMVQKMPPEN